MVAVASQFKTKMDESSLLQLSKTNAGPNTLNQPEPLHLFEAEDLAPSIDLLSVDIRQISIAEVKTAIRLLRSGKAAGLDETLPEMLKPSWKPPLQDS